MREGVLARGDQPRLLAGQRTDAVAGVLRVRRSRAARIRRDRQACGRFYHQELGEFILPYEAVRTADDPDRRCANSSTARRCKARRSQVGIARRSRRTHRERVLDPPRARTYAMTAKTDRELLAVDEREVWISNPHKILFPQPATRNSIWFVTT